MSEDYKKIALEDVKKGQRVQISLYYESHVASYTGTVLSTEFSGERVTLGQGSHEFNVYLTDRLTPDILLLEDVPEPKVVSIKTVTVTRYDDGTEKTETVSGGVLVPMSDDGGTERVPTPTAIHTMGEFEEFEEFEDYLKTVILKDTDGDYWAYRDGQWRWTFGSLLPGITWNTPTTQDTIEQSLPMTVVDNVGD